MSSAPKNQFQPPNLPAPPLSGVQLPGRPSYLDSSMPNPDTIRQQFNQGGGGLMPRMPSDTGNSGFDPNTDPNFLASLQGLRQKGINVPNMPTGGGQGNVPPPQPMQMQGGIPMSALGIPQFQPGMKPNFTPPSQDQMDKLRALINQSIAGKQLQSGNVGGTSQ